MYGFKPNEDIWKRVNAAIMGEDMGETAVTLISGLCSMLMVAGVAKDETQARVHLAAMLLSPDGSPEPGALLPMLDAELKRLGDESGGTG